MVVLENLIPEFGCVLFWLVFVGGVLSRAFLFGNVTVKIRILVLLQDLSFRYEFLIVGICIQLSEILLNTLSFGA